MFLRFTRPALVGLLTALAAAALPAVASAAISPTLTLSGDTAAGKRLASVGFDIKFNPSPGSDSPKDVTIAFPPGLLADHTVNNGACTTTTPVSACQIGSGTATLNGVPNPVTAYLVAPPSSADIAGLDVVFGPQSSPLASATGAITLRTTPDVGLNIAFTNLPNVGLDELNIAFTNMRLPSSCPTTPANVTVTADSQAAPTTKTATAPLAVSGCASLAYAPKLTATVTKDAKDSGATVLTTVTQNANESASKSIEFDLPSSLAPNTADLACLNATGCKIGTASAASPLVPTGGALANGTVTLAGTLAAPTIAISFPSPLAISIVGTVNLTSLSVTFASVPDLPLTSLTMTLNSGPAGSKAFNTSCAPGKVVGKFTPQDSAATQTVPAVIAYANCAGAPTSSGSVAGLAAGHPKLRFKVTAGSNAPLVSSLSVGLPNGLGFNRKAISTSTKCKRTGKKKCATTVTIKGLTASGGTVSGARIAGGRLVITFKKASKGATITLGAPLLTESTALQTKVKKRKVKSVTVTVKVTDAKHATTALALKLKV